MQEPADSSLAIQNALVQEAQGRLVSSALGNFLVLLLFMAGINVHLTGLLLCLAAVHAFITSLRYALARGALPDAGPAQNRWRFKYRLLAWLNGLLWAGLIAGALRTTPHAPWVPFFVVTTTAGLTGAAVANLSVLPYTFPIYCVLLLSGLAIGLVGRTDLPALLPVLSTMVVYAAYLMTQARIGRRQILERLLVESALRKAQDELRVLLRERVQVEHASRLAHLGEMAGGIAHEINNPLTIILGHAQMGLLMLDRGEHHTKLDKLRASLEKIEQTSHRIEQIIRGLKNFARDGTNEPMAVISLGAIIEETIAMYSDRFRKKGIVLEWKNEAPEVRIPCVAVQVQQVLINLLGNALDATEGVEKGWVRIHTSLDGGPFVLVAIEDGGSGVPEAIRHRILEPFFSTKPVGKGTGLGLSISLGIVERHRGTLSLDSASAPTRFILRLPLFEPEATRQAAA
jgi:signal transduction histidine kinase